MQRPVEPPMELTVINRATRRLITNIAPKSPKFQYLAFTIARQGAHHYARTLWLVRTIQKDHFHYWSCGDKMICEDRDAPCMKISYFHPPILLIFWLSLMQFGFKCSYEPKMLKMWDMKTACPPNESPNTPSKHWNSLKAPYCDAAGKLADIRISADPAGKSADIKKYSMNQNFGYKTNCKYSFCTTKIFWVCVIIFLSALKFKNCIFSLFSMENWFLKENPAFSFTPMELAPPESNSPDFKENFSLWSYIDLEWFKPISEPIGKFLIRRSRMNQILRLFFFKRRLFLRNERLHMEKAQSLRNCSTFMSNWRCEEGL